jgi:hypothetical protein
MKRKTTDPDLESMLDAVAKDHIAGRTVMKRPIAAPAGRGKKPAPGDAPGRKGLLAALQVAAVSKGAGEASGAPPDALQADGEAEDASVPPEDGGEDDAASRRRLVREERQAAKLRAEKASIKSALDLAKQEKEALKAELQKTVRQRDAAVREAEAARAGHEASAHDLFDAWRREAGLAFRSPKGKAAVEDAMAANADAFALAERALAAQAAANAKYGTVRALREEFERIDRLTEALCVAERESLFTVPEIRKALGALDARRRKLLADPESAALLAPADPEVVMLSLRAIDALPDGKGALPQIERFQSAAALLESTGLADPEGAGRIRRVLEAKVRRVIRAEATRAAGRPGIREESFESLVLEGGAARFTLMVDGNNVLVTNETVFGDGGVIPDFTGKRDRLNQALGRLSRAFRRVFAVYDGNEARTEPAGERFEVVFTEKLQQVADDWIAERVSGEPVDSCILATDDAGLIARCPGVHAVIGSRHLYDFLARQGGRR